MTIAESWWSVGVVPAQLRSSTFQSLATLSISPGLSEGSPRISPQDCDRGGGAAPWLLACQRRPSSVSR